ncbi:hypothetical protein BJ741DRAFT_354412 [Chytriomyces cf. hyalinus JEL632]|nr:hypothetical protein BJ741DRAFT_354412 [Chytriomyces cf. hyalinus JEL632]
MFPLSIITKYRYTSLDYSDKMIQNMAHLTFNFGIEYFTSKDHTKIQTESAKIAAVSMTLANPTSATAPNKLTRILVRENEYSLYSHKPRVLTSDLAFARHLIMPVIEGPKPSFFPSPDLIVASTSTYYTVSNNKVEKPLSHSETHFHTFKPPVQRSATLTQDISDKPAPQHKKPKKLSRGQKLAAASKLAKASSALKP